MITGEIRVLNIWILSAKWCLCFLIQFLGLHYFSSKEQASFNFMAAVTICSDSGAQEDKVCHCFHCFSIYLPWSYGTHCHDIYLIFECWLLKSRQSIKKQRHHFANKSPSTPNYGFSSSHVWMWELNHKEGWTPKNWCFELWCWRIFLRVTWAARRSNQSILKEINAVYPLEGLMLKLKL